MKVESARSRRDPLAVVILLCLSVSVMLTVLDAGFRLERVRKLTEIRLSDQPPHTARIAPNAREEHLLLPGSSMDARWWVLHTRAMIKAGDFRVRNTGLDNAPEGREVHWSSLLMWVLAAISSAMSWFGGGDRVELVAQAALWAGPLMQAGFLVVLGGLVFRRFGWLPAAFFGLVFLSSYPISRTFQAGEADHHGIVISFAAAGLLCLIAGGAGFCRRSGGKSPCGFPLRAEAAGWFTLGGILGAASLWISAATAIPILLGTALGAVAATLISRSDSKAFQIDPDLWMVWARSGFIASVGFYLLEYFPGHLGWRLEVNHPLYALAWLGGGFLLKMMLLITATRKQPRWTPGLVVLMGLAGAAVAAPAIAICLWPGRVFWVADSFLLSLHKEYIIEFKSLPALIAHAGGGLGFLTYYPWPAFVVASGIWLSVARAWSESSLRSFLLVLPATLIMQGLAIYQVRWSSASFALWAVCALCIFLNFCSGSPLAPPVRWVRRLAMAVCVLSLLVTQVPQVATAAMAVDKCTKPPIKEDAGNGIILRDIAHRLIQSSPGRIPTVLTGPNSSTDLAFHGQIRTLGTLYWENMPGLKRAARIFSSRNEEEALTALTAAGITHIVIPSWDNFSDAYTGLLKVDGAPGAESGYFQSLLKGEDWPTWLRPFAYPIPTASGLDSNSVRIFAVLPQQNAFETAFFRGVYHFESGEMKKARAFFEKAENIRPGDPRAKSYRDMIDASASQGADK